MVEPATGLDGAEWFRPSEYRGELELLVGAPALRVWSPRICEGVEIVVLVGAPHVVHVNGVAHEAPVGVPFLVPAGTIWSAKRTTAGFFSLELGPMLFSRLCDQWPGRRWIMGPGFPRLHDRKMLETFWHSHKVLRAHGEAIARSQALIQLFTTVFEQLSGVPMRPTLVPAAGLERVRALLHEDPARDADLAQLAAVAGVSIFQLARAFKRRHGVTPWRYRDALRVSRARRLLAASHAVAEVAAALGFPSEPAFRSVFERNVGVGPERYAA
jgi:AraC-like DNA-binding protein